MRLYILIYILISKVLTIQYVTCSTTQFDLAFKSSLQCFKQECKVSLFSTLVMDKVTVDFSTLQHNFFSSLQVNWNWITIAKRSMNQLSHGLSNELKIRILENQEMSRKFLKNLKLMTSPQLATQKPNLVLDNCFENV